MKKFTLITVFVALLCFVACRREALPVEPETPTIEMEDVSFCADVDDDQTKVDFEYNSGLYMKWHGDEQLHVFIKHSDGTIEQPEAGIIDCIPESLSPNRFSLEFAGSVRARKNPETDKFVFVYADIETVVVKGQQKVMYNYNLNKQTVVVNGDEGLGDLQHSCPIVFEYDAEDNIVVSKKACVIKLIASNLPVNAKVTGLTIYAGADENVFPTVVDVTTFDYLSSNKSNSLSYAFENAVTDSNGEVTLYMTAPLVSGSKNYEIDVVCEKDGEYQTKKAVKSITGESALSVSKLYKLTRDAWAGGINPGTVVGNPEDNMESIVGQWDKTGFLSNDIYGVLDLGKPENLSLEHNAIINLIQKAYTKTSGDNDIYVHPAAVLAAGKAGQKEKTSHPMTSDGPQYVRVSGDYSSSEDLTFNNIVLKEPTQLYMTFVDSKAWNTNTIGYYCYPTAQEESYKTKTGHDDIHEMVVFPSTSQNLTDPTVTHKFDAKTTAMLLYPQYDAEHQLTGAMKKEFAAGTTVGIFGYTNGLDTSKDFALLPLTQGSGCKGVHYTNIAWNRRNWFSPDEESRPYWNQIAVLRVIMPGEHTPRTDCLIVTMKDEYTWHGSGQDARTWTNPILLIYATNPNAIDFMAGDRADRWTSSVDMNGLTFGINYDLDGVTSTNTANSFSGSYQSTIRVANTEFGSFCNFSVVAGGVDITEHVVSFNAERTQAEVNIPRTKAAGEIKITAHAAKNVMVQSLTASQLMELAKQTGDLPTYRLILHCSTNTADKVVAFGMDKNGSYCRPFAQCPFANKTYQDPTTVKVEDQYNDYEWSLEKTTDSEGRFVGFKLKKVTKITDTEVTVDGYITRGSDNYAKLTGSGTALTAEAIDSGYEMKLKSPDSSYQYMTCAIGSTLKNAAFWQGGHVDLYGKWRVYKVWLQDAPAGN